MRSRRGMLCRALTLITVSMLLVHCNGGGNEYSLPGESNRQAEREEMVNEWVEASGVKNPVVLDAMRRVPRHSFVPEKYARSAYQDRPLPIGYDQSISQPSLVAYMIEALDLKGNEKVLEIGTGSGYQAALLAEIVPQVWTIEIIPALAMRAEETLAELGYRNIRVRTGDGYKGWPEEAPFDAIILTAAPKDIPSPLLEQLAIGGRLIAPVGGFIQDLVLVRRTKDGYKRSTLLSVRFVPMTGEAERAP